MAKTLSQMSDEVYEVNVANGWFESDRSFGEGLALLHSELSEALEAYREHGLRDVASLRLGPRDPWPTSTELVRVLSEAGLEFEHDGRGRITSLPELSFGAVNFTDEHRLILARLGVMKPEGVGSELADVLIRLLDEARRQGVDIDAIFAQLSAEMLPISEASLRVQFAESTFGEGLSVLHAAVVNLNGDTALARHVAFAVLHTALAAFANVHGVDLDAEYERKLAFNRTRGHRHGGKRL